MVNPQLVEYFDSQMKAGAARDEIKNALITAGWSAADVEDSLRSREAAAPAAPQRSAPAQPSPAQRPASISVSDLIAGSNQLSSIPNVVNSSRMPSSASQKTQTEKRSFKMPRLPILPIVLGLVAVIALAAAGYFYMQNKDAQNKEVTLMDASNSATSQLSDLTSQVATLTKSQNDLTAQIASLTTMNAALQGELMFFAVPASSTFSSTSTISVNFKGMVSGGGKSLYIITGDDGVKLSILNSKDAQVDTALKPLVGQEAQVAGTHTAGSNILNVTAVNGTSLL